MAETGRPSLYSEAMILKICEGIAKGKGLAQVCKAKGMPTPTTVYRWLEDDAKVSFREQYARAREQQAMHHADEIIRIADECEDPNKARLQIDARKWLASKQAPKKYGDRVIHAGDVENPVAVKDVSDGDLARRAAFLLQSARPESPGRTKANGHAGNGKTSLDS